MALTPSPSPSWRGAIRRAFAIVLLLAITGCQSTGPVEPTLIVLPTQTVRPSPSAAPNVTLPSPTLPPTWTPLPTIPPKPTQLPIPSVTPPPSTATLDTTAAIPIAVTSYERGAVTLRLTEAQLNAALARKFDAAPLAKYTGSPRIALGFGAMQLTSRITPQQSSQQASSGPQTMALTIQLAIYAGALEVRPVQLAPLDSAVTTRQVKLGQALLEQTLFDLINQAAGSPRALSYNYVDIQPDGVAVTVVVQ
jgi:hypothetical protein